MILHLRMQKISITDAVIKWWFNLASAWLERKQPIHLTNEVISAIGWPCRFTYGYYTLCEVLSELCWPCHGGGWNSEWIRWISDPSNPNLAWPTLKSVKMRPSIDRIFDFSVWSSFQHTIKGVQDETKNSSGQLSHTAHQVLDLTDVAIRSLHLGNMSWKLPTTQKFTLF